jgi:hypothetical protein
VTETTPFPHRMARLGGHLLHAATMLGSGAFQTACGYLSGPGDNKHFNDERPITCRECTRSIRREAAESTPAADAAQRLERSRQAPTVGAAIIALIPGAAGVIRP